MVSPPISSILLPDLTNVYTRADSNQWLQIEISSLHVYQDETLACSLLQVEIKPKLINSAKISRNLRQRPQIKMRLFSCPHYFPKSVKLMTKRSLSCPPTTPFKSPQKAKILQKTIKLNEPS